MDESIKPGNAASASKAKKKKARRERKKQKQEKEKMNKKIRKKIQHQNKLNLVHIDKLKHLLSQSPEDALRFYESKLHLLRHTISELKIKDCHLNVLIQVIAAKFCAHTSTMQSVQRELVITVTHPQLFSRILKYIKRLIPNWLKELVKTSDLELHLESDPPLCAPHELLQHLGKYFMFVNENIPEGRPKKFYECVSTLDKFVQTFNTAIINLKSTSWMTEDCSNLAISFDPSIHCLAVANEPLGLDVLASLLDKPLQEVVQFVYNHRYYLSPLISNFEANPASESPLNVFIQVLGSNVCGTTSVSASLKEMQHKIILIVTNSIFQCLLLDYLNGLNKLVLHERCDEVFRNSDCLPFCSEMTLLKNLLKYYSFLLETDIQETSSFSFSQLLQNIQAARLVLHNVQITGRVNLFSETNAPAFHLLQSSFKSLEKSYNKKWSSIKTTKCVTVSEATMRPPADALNSDQDANNGANNNTEMIELSTDVPFGINNLLLMMNSSVAPEHVVTFIHGKRKPLLIFISKNEISDRHLNILVQVIAVKLCGTKTVSVFKFQNELVQILLADEFLDQLYHYTRLLLRDLHTSQQETPPYCPALEIMKHLYTFYNFAQLNCDLPSTLLANIESACALLTNCKQNRKFEKVLSESSLAAAQLKLLEKYFAHLKQLLAASKTKLVSPSAASTSVQQITSTAETIAAELKSLHLSNINKRAEEQSVSGCIKSSDKDIQEIQDCFPSWDFENVVPEYRCDYNFMKMRDVPSKNEISAEIGPTLNPMPTVGNHKSALIYLKDQYRLLREDFVGPLRQFLTSAMRKERKFYLGSQNPKSKSKIVRFYHGVRFHLIDGKSDSSTADLVKTRSKFSTIRFSYPKLSETEWEDNDWLLPESLVILSSDNFKTIYIATVTYKNKFQLAKGFLTIMWEGVQPPVLEGLTFIMAESEAYFVSYRYTLKALQIMAKPLPPDFETPLFATYPMAKYIVDMSTGHVPSPKYLRNTSKLLNFAALTQDYLFYEAHPTDVATWPLCSDIEMDSAQFSAFHLAVTQELCIIQGPPGTGKTYIGLQLMKLFLSNPQIYEDPILIVCRTNHALDQFLEGVLPIMEKLNVPLKENLLRVGGGSESELLEKYIVRQKRIKKDLKIVDKAHACAPMPSKESANAELQSLQQQAADLSNLLSQLLRAESFGEIAKLTEQTCLKDLLETQLELETESNLNIRGESHSDFITKATKYLLEQVAVININIGILSDQEIFRGNDVLKSKGTGREKWPGKVIGMTTTGAAKHTSWVRFMQPKIVIVEEAAEVLESHIVTSITEHCEHLILIGDHKQLRPLTMVHKLATDFHLDVSLFERLIKNKLNWSCLETQHRMRPEICKLLTPTIYERLENHPDVMNYPDVAGFAKNLFFINHRENELVDTESVSKANEYEARYVAALCRHLVLQNYEPSQITILITYNGQKQLVEQLIEGLGEPFSSVKVKTVDSYQGEENDVIILSLVRSNPKNNIGFLSIENRICVALSRARHGFYIIGNMNCLLKSKSKMWAQISAELERQRSIGEQLQLKCQIHKNNYHIQTPEDFISKAPEGGCSKMCNAVLPKCEHRCPKFCHVVDRTHTNYKCQVEVRVQLKCGHARSVSCHEAALELLDDLICDSKCLAELDCGHLCVETCHAHLDPGHENIICKKQCVRRCEEGHPCATYHLCHQDCQPCKVLLNYLLPCGHVVNNVECFQDLSYVKSLCKSVCNKILPSCNHRCPKLCHTKDKEHKKVKCMALVDFKFKCGHLIKLQCHQTTSEQINKIVCESRCRRRLQCGHVCVEKCHQVSDPFHQNVKCMKFCMKSCPKGHRCTTKHACNEDCPPCEVLVDKELNCGCGYVVKNSMCSTNIAYLRLTHWCPRKLCGEILSKCGHPCPEYVHEHIGGKDTYHRRYLCQKWVSTVLDCGHVKRIQCHQKSTNFEIFTTCDEQCGVTLECGHLCRSTCHAMTYPSHGDPWFSCTSKCERKCKLGHPCDPPHPCIQDCSKCQTCKQEEWGCSIC